MEKLLVNLVDASTIFEEVELLKDINFSLAEAEFSYIIGKTGSGKSSLLKLIYGAYPLCSGHGTVLDFDLKKVTNDDISTLRRSLGIVFQNYSLFEGWSVFDNLDFVLKVTNWKDKEARKIRIHEVLKEVDLLDKVTVEVHRMSGGEQQRLTIARAILNRPTLILADEPTGSLDPDSADDILYLLHRIARKNKTAVIFATHDYRLIDKFPARVYRCINRSLEEINV